MEYTVETQGMALGVGRRMFVCDAEGSVIVEVFGTDPEDAERRAEVVADALNATVKPEVERPPDPYLSYWCNKRYKDHSPCHSDECECPCHKEAS